MKLSQPCGPGADPDVSVTIAQNGIYTRSCQSLGHGVDMNGLPLNAKYTFSFRADPDIVLGVIDDRVVADRVLQLGSRQIERSIQMCIDRCLPRWVRRVLERRQKRLRMHGPRIVKEAREMTLRQL